MSLTVKSAAISTPTPGSIARGTKPTLAQFPAETVVSGSFPAMQSVTEVQPRPSLMAVEDLIARNQKILAGNPPPAADSLTAKPLQLGQPSLLGPRPAFDSAHQKPPENIPAQPLIPRPNSPTIAHKPTAPITKKLGQAPLWDPLNSQPILFNPNPASTPMDHISSPAQNTGPQIATDGCDPITQAQHLVKAADPADIIFGSFTESGPIRPQPTALGP